MIRKICGVEETDNPDGICDNCGDCNPEPPEDGTGRKLIFTMEERYFLLPIPLLGAKAKNDNAAED